MSFSKAKRFNYKPPDIDCSPADYLLSLGFEKGCSMSKCSRFQNCKMDEDCSVNNCSRSSHHTHSIQNDCCAKHDKKIMHNRLAEFSRNDATRKSVKGSKANDQTKTTQFHTNKQLEYYPMDETLCQTEEFIDDDYGSMTCFTELDNLKDLEEYEFNEVYKALKRILEKRQAVSQDDDLNFQDAVLKKLETIDRNVKIIKEDVGYSPQNALVEQIDCHYRSQIEDSNFRNQSQSLNMKNNQQQLKSMVVRTIQNLGKNFDNKRRSILRDSENRILDILDEMYAANDKSSAQIKDLCNVTGQELVTNLNKLLQTSMCDSVSESEIEDVIEEFINKYYGGKTLRKSNSAPLQNIISDYLIQTQEVSQDLEEDLSDITLKCADTEHMLHVQGVLLDEMKHEIENLKSSMGEN